jgi:arylsulfatase A-like enzyme
MTIDIGPTILATAGINYAQVANFDGMDLSGHVLNQDTIAGRPLFWRQEGSKAVRIKNWKLKIDGSDTALYDLHKDISEIDNVVRDHRNIVDLLKAELKYWEDGL